MSDQKEVELGEVLEVIASLEERRTELKKQFEAEDRKLKEKVERGKGWILQNLQAQGVQNITINGRLVYISKTMRAGVGDWALISDYIAKTGEVDLLEHRVSSKAVKEFMDEHNGQVPPGVKVDPKVTVNIQKARAKK